ncbi:MAG: sigma-70 family RNA polymerase sigma factor [Chloroflexia bacterium]|nr:sigma-70 family RNA polymerase sigma factor [Chloroflexia bacterium]
MDRERPTSSLANEQTVRLLREAHGYVLGLPPDERQIATMAADGSPVWEIAQHMRISDEAVAHALDRIVAVLTGRAVEKVESGGLGADTDPGISGGYDVEPLGSGSG